MSYVDEIYERVVAQNPGEPEFHQAVKEVLDSLKLVIDANEEKYRREGILERFIEQMRLADKGDDEAMVIDKDFLRALQYGMPPTSGIGIGIDRLVMLMTGKTFIQEVLFFPQMKPEKKIPQDNEAEWCKIGVAPEWVPVLRKAGFNLVTNIKDEKAQGLQQKIGDIVKRYKLDMKKPSVDDIQQWIEKINK